MDVIPLQPFDEACHRNSLDWGDSYFWNWEGLRCRWRLLGPDKGPAIVFIHGFGASSAHWRNNSAFFAAAGYRVFSMDLVGFGESDQPGAKTFRKLDNFIWSQQLIAFLEQVVEVGSLGKAILIGNSLGSLVALTALVHRKDLVAAVVASPLPDPAFLQARSSFGIPFIKKLRDFLVKIFCWLLPLELIVPFIARTRIIKKALQSAYCRSIELDYDLVRIVTLPALRSSAPRSLRAMCIGMTVRPVSITAPELLKCLGNCIDRVPILLLWGLQDRLVPIKIGQLIVKLYPWINLAAIENTGHCPHDESPNEFNKYVMNWLELNLDRDRKES